MTAECPRCHGTGFAGETRGGREFAVPCSCRAPSGGRRAAREPLETARIPAAHRACSLGNFRPRTPALTSAYAAALRYCEQFPALGRQQGIGLVFWGTKGTGKTHLAVGVLAEVATNGGVAGLFSDFGSLMSEIARSFDARSGTTEMRTLEPIIAADLLVLDDLGAQKMTPWADDVLFHILNTRYMSKRPTIITTRFEDVDREVALAAGALHRAEFLIERIGSRLRSRLLEMSVFIPMETSSDRKSALSQGKRPATLAAMRRSIPKS